MKKSIYRRNIKFKNAIDKVNKKKIVGVAIDPSKHFHRVVIFDFTGKLQMEPFSIDTLKTGYEILRKNINNSARKISAKEIFIAVEICRMYSEILANQLNKDFRNVFLVTSNAVAENRKQKSLVGLKNDDIDAGSIGDLLIRGEFYESNIESNYYRILKEFVYWRENKVKLLVVLKNQVEARMNKIYSGLNNDYDDNERMYRFPSKSRIYQGIINESISPYELIKKSDLELLELFGYKTKSHKYRMTILKERVNNILLPDKEIIDAQIDLLKRDVSALRMIEKELAEIERKIVGILKKTPLNRVSKEIKGVSDVCLGIYTGLVGDINKYPTAKHIFSKSGLTPLINQSGVKKHKGYRIKKAGNRILRAILFRMASMVIMNEPYFIKYNERIKNKKKNWKINRIIVANKLNRIIFAIARDKTTFKRL